MQDRQGVHIPITDLRHELDKGSNGFDAQKAPQQQAPVKVTQNLYNTPAETYQIILKGAMKKKNETLDQLFCYGFLAGTYIALGSMLAIVFADGIANDPDTMKALPNSQGLQKFLFGAVFPVGLVFVLIAGSSLFTGNCLFMMAGWLSRDKTKITIMDVLRVLIGSWIANLAGSLFVAYFMGYLTGILTVEPWKTGTMGHAILKAQTLDRDMIFWRSIGCNWLVCLAVWLCAAARDVGGKIWAIWWPIMAFVTIGFEHSVANMFFIPMGILVGADVTWGDFFAHNLMIVTCGNFLGGGIFVAFLYYYYLQGSKEIMKLMGEDSAVWNCCNVGSQQREQYMASGQQRRLLEDDGQKQQHFT